MTFIQLVKSKLFLLPTNAANLKAGHQDTLKVLWCSKCMQQVREIAPIVFLFPLPLLHQISQPNC